MFEDFTAKMAFLSNTCTLAGVLLLRHELNPKTPEERPADVFDSGEGLTGMLLIINV